MAAVESTATRDVERADRVVRGIVQGWYEMDYMNPYLLLDLADAYRRNGRPDLAIAVRKQGPRFYAGAFEMHLFYSYIAEAYLALGDRENARRYFAQYLVLFPRDERVVERVRELGGEPARRER